MGSKGAFARVPNRPLSYSKIYNIKRFVGEFDNSSKLPSSAIKFDYAIVGKETYIFNTSWNKAPFDFVLPSKKELIVDYTNKIIYICDDNRNITQVASGGSSNNNDISADNVIYIQNNDGVAERRQLSEIIDKLLSYNDTSFNRLNKKITISCKPEKWDYSEENMAYIQKIDIEDITSESMPIVDVLLSENYVTATSQLEEYGKIYSIGTFDGYINVYANEITTIDIEIVLS